MTEDARRWWFVVPLDEDRRGNVGLARPVERDRGRDRMRREQMVDGLVIEDWAEEELTLEDGGFGDYPRELRGFRLCSDRLRHVLDEQAGKQDRLQWLGVYVADRGGERRRYWILNLPRPAAAEIPGLEEFDWQGLRERAADGSLDDFSVLPGPGFGVISFLVPERVRHAILESGCDVAFRPL